MRQDIFAELKNKGQTIFLKIKGFKMKTLYAFRPALKPIVVAYENVENDFYRDTSCSDHENCLVKISPIKDKDGEYEVVECINETAKNYRHFRKYDTPLFKTVAEAIKSYADFEKKDYLFQIEERKKKIAELEAKRKSTANENELTIKTPKIDDFDFGDTVFLVNKTPYQTKILEFKVYSKVVEKDGVKELRSGDFNINLDDELDDEPEISGYRVNDRLRLIDDNDYFAFKDLQSAENFHKKIEVQNLEKMILDQKRMISNLEKSIEQLKSKTIEVKGL